MLAGLVICPLSLALASCGGMKDPAPAIAVVQAATPTSTSGDDAAPAALSRKLAAATIGDAVGVQVQSWYLRREDLARIETLGISTVRWGISWEQVETVKGVYDWRAVDAFVSELAKTRLRSVVILGLGNRLYANGVDGAPSASTAPAPTSASARTAFANFAAAAARRYGDKAIKWEIWNEPDSAAFWGPAPDADGYALLSNEACRAMKAATPNAFVIGGATGAMPSAMAWNPWNTFARLISHGATACLDALSYHPYRMEGYYQLPSPDSVDAENRKSASYLFDNLGVSRRTPLYVTEWGYPATGQSPELQLAYMIRGILINLLSQVDLTIWYEWRDSQSGSGPEATFGLNTMYGGPKASARGYDAMSAITHSSIISRVETGSAGVSAVTIMRDSKYYLVVWLDTSDEHSSRRLTVNGTISVAATFMPSVLAIDKAAGLTVEQS